MRMRPGGATKRWSSSPDVGKSPLSPSRTCTITRRDVLPVSLLRIPFSGISSFFVFVVKTLPETNCGTSISLPSIFPRKTPESKSITVSISNGSAIDVPSITSITGINRFSTCWTTSPSSDDFSSIVSPSLLSLAFLLFIALPALV